MDPTPSKSITDLERFLTVKGLTCHHREGPDPKHFGNRVLEYADGNIGVRLILDRNIWLVEIADVAGRADEWYDPGILRDLTLGPSEDSLSLAEQIDFIEAHWPAILNSFSSAQRDYTHTQLGSLRRNRAKRLFPDFYPQVGRPN